MSEKKSALAELAEDLEEIVRDTKSDFYTTAISKSQRIVAELAKVEESIQLARGHGKTFTHLYEFLEADKNRAVEIVRNCRVIAAEGAGDGK